MEKFKMSNFTEEFKFKNMHPQDFDAMVQSIQEFGTDYGFNVMINRATKEIIINGTTFQDKNIVGYINTLFIK